MVRKLFFVSLFIMLVFGLSSATATAQGPMGTKPHAPRAALSTAFTYQGQLKSGGSAYTGTCDMQFTLYDAASSGTQIGTTQTVSGVSVTNGLFTTTPIDFGAGAFDGNKRFLQIAVMCGGEMSYTTLAPLQELTATPYALFSANASWSGLSGIPNPVTFLASPSSCSNGQVATWNGTTWTCTTTASGWALTGNSGTTYGTNFLGTTDNVSLTLRANNVVGWRLAPSGTWTPNVIGGYSGNWVTSGVWGATIGGGGASANLNRVTDEYGTVGGGYNNQAGDNAGITTDRGYTTVGGGQNNTASGYDATVGGGQSNNASDYGTAIGGGLGNTAGNTYATVGGGKSNTASGKGAFVGGGGYDGTSTSGNQAVGNASTIGGGLGNSIPVAGTYATVGGGSSNTASGSGAFVGGGGYDGTNTYGNKALGNASTIGGGYNNTAAGGSATVAGGDNNSTGDVRATVGGGYNNHANGRFDTVGGGESNTASNYHATVGGGNGNVANNKYGTVPGGYAANASHYGEMAYASGYFAAAGDAQTSLYVVRATTGDASPTELFLDGAGVSNRITIAPGRTVTFDILVVARTNAGVSAGYRIAGVIKNQGGTAFPGGVPGAVALGADGGAVGWAVVVATDANNALEVKVTGAAATTIAWVATVRTVEVSY